MAQKSQGTGTSNRGFASMDAGKQREIASKGGQSVPAAKRSFSQDRRLAAEAGRKGGQSSHGGGRSKQPVNSRTDLRNRDAARRQQRYRRDGGRARARLERAREGGFSLKFAALKRGRAGGELFVTAPYRYGPGTPPQPEIPPVPSPRPSPTPEPTPEIPAPPTPHPDLPSNPPTG